MILTGDCLEILPTLEAESVQCCVTSPPYYGLRDYGTAQWEGGDPECDHRKPPGGGHGELSPIGKGERDVEIMTSQRYFNVCRKCGAVRIDSQIGLEPSPDAYVEKLVRVFREIKRVLRADGTVWLNLGDSYWGGKGQSAHADAERHIKRFADGKTLQRPYQEIGKQGETNNKDGKHNVIKPKDLIGIPWRVAFALQADGWYLRSEIIWHKPNPMPESVTDRPTKSHEQIFLLTKNARYFYDAEAIKEPQKECTTERYKYGWDGVDDDGSKGARTGSAYKKMKAGMNMGEAMGGNGMRNKRSVWTITTKPFKEAHFATFPPEIPEICIKAGTSEKGCCPKCGSPWERIIKQEISGGVPDPNATHYKVANSKYEVATERGFSGTKSNRATINITTTGWRPTCTHNLDPVPCTVLDPFSGAGTTGLVAEKLGRKYIGIDIKPAYNEMAEKRIGAVRLPLLEAL